MIQSIDLYNLRNGEFLQLMTDILAIVLKNNPDDLKVSKQYNALLALTNQTESLFKISQGSAITQLLLDLDARRDNAIIGIGYLINGFSYSNDSIVAGHAKILADHLSLFGSSIARDNFISETASIRNVVNDYNNKAELQAPLTALNLDSWKTELETSNDLFSKAYMDRSEEMASASADTLKAKRNETNAAYYSLRDTINAYFTLSEGAEPYASITNLVNAYIDQYNTLLYGRIGKTPIVVQPTTKL